MKDGTWDTIWKGAAGAVLAGVVIVGLQNLGTQAPPKDSAVTEAIIVRIEANLKTVTENQQQVLTRLAKVETELQDVKQQLEHHIADQRKVTGQ